MGIVSKSSSDRRATGDGAIKVFIRVRPLTLDFGHLVPSEHVRITPRERVPDPENGDLIQVSGDQTMQISDDEFRFEKVFEADVLNQPIFDVVGEPAVQKCMEGFNTSIFAYGQTGSGKTHTMLGTETDPGILRLAVKSIIDRCNACTVRRYLLRFECVEIYNEEVCDLLSTSLKKLKIVDHALKGPLCISDQKGDKHETEHFVTSANEVNALIDTGLKSRHVAAHAMNATSSRSHAIVRLTVDSREAKDDPPGLVPLCDVYKELQEARKMAVTTSTFNFVDLAGSERASKTLATGTILKEGSMINKSLTSLGMVIRQLASANGKSVHVPYRDSKLTRLLQTCLGGNSVSVAIANITNAEEHIEETRNTLRFASFTKDVINRATKNIAVSSEALVQEYKDQIEALQRALSTPMEDQLTNLKAQLEEERQVAEEERQLASQVSTEQERAMRKSETASRMMRAVMKQQTIKLKQGHRGATSEELSRISSRSSGTGTEAHNMCKQLKAALMWQRLRFQSAVATLQRGNQLLTDDLDLLTKVGGQQGDLVNELKAESTRMIELAKGNSPWEAQLREESAKLKNANEILEEDLRVTSHREIRETTRLKTEIEALQAFTAEVEAAQSRQLQKQKIANYWQNGTLRTLLLVVKAEAETTQEDLTKANALIQSLSKRYSERERELEQREREKGVENQLTERRRFSGVWTADLVAQQRRIMALEAQLGLTPAEWWKPLAAKLRRSLKGAMDNLNFWTRKYNIDIHNRGNQQGLLLLAGYYLGRGIEARSSQGKRKKQNIKNWQI